jgi:hypothetical protein
MLTLYEADWGWRRAVNQEARGKAMGNIGSGMKFNVRAKVLYVLPVPFAARISSNDAIER